MQSVWQGSHGSSFLKIMALRDLRRAEEIRTKNVCIPPRESLQNFSGISVESVLGSFLGVIFGPFWGSFLGPLFRFLFFFVFLCFCFFVVFFLFFFVLVCFLFWFCFLKLVCIVLTYFLLSPCLRFSTFAFDFKIRHSRLQLMKYTKIDLWMCFALVVLR